MFGGGGGVGPPMGGGGAPGSAQAGLPFGGIPVGLIAIFTQLGPSLVSYAINHGLTPPHYDYGIVILMAVLYLVSIVVSGSAQWGQARVTGRLASWVMNDLRIKVFRHLQRLS